MSGRNWDDELKKVDRALEGVADAAAPVAKPAASPEAHVAAAVDAPKTTSAFGVFARLGLAAALGVAIVFWPYGARCGVELAGYLVAVTTLIAAGAWSAIWTWRHRSARGHTLALLLVLWGLVLGSIEVLPRAGYAVATPDHPAMWTCP